MEEGGGTGGSRSLTAEGAAILEAAEKVIEKGRIAAARHFEAAVEDVVFADGVFRVKGTDRAVDVIELARIVKSWSARPPELENGLDAEARIELPAWTFPNGCHIAEVEIDPETGVVSLERYTVVDDFGVVLNPLLVAGQVHGGVAQGVGQALTERTVYDPDSGQLLTATFLDYAIPRADDLCAIDFSWIEVPCRNNPLGVKGCGEAGSIGSPPAVINAVVDALAELGVRHVDMPATPARVREVIGRARGRGRDRGGAGGGRGGSRLRGAGQSLRRRQVGDGLRHEPPGSASLHPLRPGDGNRRPDGMRGGRYGQLLACLPAGPPHGAARRLHRHLPNPSVPVGTGTAAAVAVPVFRQATRLSGVRAPAGGARYQGSSSTSSTGASPKPLKRVARTLL
ncbi:Carbon monoxide dehydrogenase large chain [bacterium HR39]|nr:Carbon monoxide dehydrogenase large chain [bacterium HR39]